MEICANCKYLKEVNLYYDDGEGLKSYGEATFCSHLDDFTKNKNSCDNFERRL